MHALSHSLAHRAPPATRTRVRWQPYSSISTSSMTTSLSPPSSTFFNTPSSSATSSPSLPSSRELNRLPSKTPSHPTKEISTRELSKNRLALGLVDQAINSLSEIWKPQDIPAVFLTGPKVTMTLDCSIGQKSQAHQFSHQLPSPSQSPPNICPLPGKQVQSTLSKNKLVPIKGFVHEVLRRSRTSGHVLQTALCYIEALRPKVPEFVRKEKAGESWNELASADAVEVQADTGIQQHAVVQLPHDNTFIANQSDSIDTFGIAQEPYEQASAPGMPGAVVSNSMYLDTLPPPVELPSPLLCPRRSFLAALILASKFTQDKCYSNRAWAKLSNLTPREISRCERALGEALQWRLWVGKLPVAPQAAPRTLHRSQSESCIKARSSEPFFIQDEPNTTTDRSLRRCSTLPSEAFITEQKTAQCAIVDISMSASQASPLDAMHSVSVQWPVSFPYQAVVDDSPDSQSSTPPLVYSPTSSDSSSSGERTTQASLTPENVPSQFNSDLRDCLPSSLSTSGIKDAGTNQGFAVAAPAVFLPVATIEDGIQTTWRLETVVS